MTMHQSFLMDPIMLLCQKCPFWVHLSLTSLRPTLMTQFMETVQSWFIVYWKGSLIFPLSLKQLL
uniref:Alternative protein CDH8 n=1 Tax=Homo sapiens TaxID=9606 RepID=L8E8U5_HUMAN|nr:alternative protein CDH8 [Homo sapiens]